VAAIWSELARPGFWIAVIQIVWINILLSGDNAVVIALACRGLPPRERRWGMVIGAAVASLLLVVFAAIVSVLMTLPFLRIVSAGALLWIAIRLLAPPQRDAEGTGEAVRDLWRAVQIVVAADIVMSLDNVIAVAAVAKGRYVLLALGLAVSIPVVIAGSAVLLALLERFTVLVWGGAAILGWVAGDVFSSDPAVAAWVSGPQGAYAVLAARFAGALAVLGAGLIWRRSAAATPT